MDEKKLLEEGEARNISKDTEEYKEGLDEIEEYAKYRDDIEATKKGEYSIKVEYEGIPVYEDEKTINFIGYKMEDPLELYSYKKDDRENLINLIKEAGNRVTIKGKRHEIRKLFSFASELYNQIWYEPTSLECKEKTPLAEYLLEEPEAKKQE